MIVNESRVKSRCGRLNEIGPREYCLIASLSALILVFLNSILISVSQSNTADIITDLQHHHHHQLQQQIDHNQVPFQLTIVVDRQRGDEHCVAFIHLLLPDWIQWRYLAVYDDNLDALQIRGPVLIVTRWMEPGSAIKSWAERHSEQSVGLMLMADETNQQNAAVYDSFQYVIRHYYFPVLDQHPEIPVRALGNLTCGSGPVWPTPPASRSPGEPRLGVHWIMLQGRGLGNLDSGHHDPRSYWPASQRRRPAIWIGSVRADRAEMLSVMRDEFPDADLKVENDFGGSLGALDYGQLRMADAVFALIPSGNNPETHRLAEAIDQGCIPVFLKADFQTATFQPVPGIVAESWPDAAQKMKSLILDLQRLDRLQQDVVQWWHRFQSCVTADLDLIFHRVIDDITPTTS